MTVWQEGKKLVVLIYEYTRQFPKDEQFVLTPQMRRAAISITSNIAEGFGRKTSRDKEHFYIMAAGSLTELENQIFISQSLGYDANKNTDELLRQTVSVGQLINGLLRAHRRQK